MGTLVVVGTGYRVAGQITVESLAAIRRAERLFFLAGDPATRDWLKSLKPDAESLHGAYAPGKSRRVSYSEMRERVLGPVRLRKRVCLALYGHPGVFASLGYDTIRVATSEGHSATMLPGVSAADNLFIDLGFDPAIGCQMYEATDLLLRRRSVDLSVPLVLWQVAAVGMVDFRRERTWVAEGFELLVDHLARLYGRKHEVTIYEAATVPLFAPRIERTPIEKLSLARVSPASTLFIPPVEIRATDEEMRSRLRFDP